MKSIATELKYGVIYTLTGFSWLLVEYFSGLHTLHKDKHSQLTWLVLVPAIFIYYLAIKEKRSKLGGTISFKQAFLSGLLVMVCALLLSPLLMPIYFNLINPSFFPDFKIYAIDSGMAPSHADAYFNLKNYILQGAIGNLFLGIIFSAVIALIMKRSARQNY